MQMGSVSPEVLGLENKSTYTISKLPKFPIHGVRFHLEYRNFHHVLLDFSIIFFQK